MVKHLIISDVDGILTTPYYIWNETKIGKLFHTNDSIIVKMLVDEISSKNSILKDLVFLTGDSIGFNISKSRISTYTGSPKVFQISNSSKILWIKEYVKGLTEKVIIHYIGDDLPDIEIFTKGKNNYFENEFHSYTSFHAPSIVKTYSDYVCESEYSTFTEIMMHIDFKHLNSVIQNKLLKKETL